MRRESQAIRDAARGQECTVRLPGVCNFDPETTVLAHIPAQAGISGVGIKPVDLSGAFMCSACHDVIDGRGQSVLPRATILECCLAGVVRTHQILVRDQIVELPK